MMTNRWSPILFRWSRDKLNDLMLPDLLQQSLADLRCGDVDPLFRIAGRFVHNTLAVDE